MNADEVSEDDGEEGAEEEDGSGEGGPSEEGNGQAQSVSCNPHSSCAPKAVLAVVP